MLHNSIILSEKETKVNKEESTLWADIAHRQQKLLHSQGAQAVGEQSWSGFALEDKEASCLSF